MMMMMLVMLCLSRTCHSEHDVVDKFLDEECLKVPVSEFVSSVKYTIDMVQQVTSLVSRFASVFGDFRLSNAIADCLDLLDLSADHLTRTISASEHPKGKNNATGHLSADLRTWLSGAFGNQDTCLESLDGTSGVAKTLVAGGLNQVTSLVRNILINVNAPNNVRTLPHGQKAMSQSGRHWPGWLKPRDKRLLLQKQPIVSNADNSTNNYVVVAADGTGNFTNIMDAVKSAPEYSSSRYVIYIKKGIYNEYVEISKKKWNIMMVGDGIDVTIISGNRSFIDGWTTYRSTTFAVKGQGFVARDMTFENTAGPEKHQAVAFRSDSDLSVVFRCGIRGYQDTLYAHSMRQFYRECQITGTVDFIFGDGTVVFQNCQILARKGLPNQKNTITAQGRKDPSESTGFSIQYCNISGEQALLASNNNSSNSTIYTYLGRPWKLYSRTVVMQSYISDVVRPEGWLEWNADFALDTLYYGEYGNYGAGSGLANRVKWPGFHVINSSAEAYNFTVGQFILGDSWLPSTGVRYTAGLKI